MDEALITRTKELITKLDLDGKRNAVRDIVAISSRPDFWKDSQSAAKQMKEMAALQKEIDEGEMLELYLEEGNTEELVRELDRMEFALYLSGPYDRGDAIFAIHSGQGGTEAMDWTSMLLRMYTRFIERKGWTADEIDYTPGEEA